MIPINEQDVRQALSGLPVRGLRFFSQTSSTNDAALIWAGNDAPDFSLVIAEEQTRGRGRGSGHWLTIRGASLAFSLILRSKPAEETNLALFSALGALAICEAVEALGLHPEIKWPNDVLLNHQKFCGLLVEAVWLNERPDCVILGIGVNVAPRSVPAREGLSFPATCLETEVGRTIDRLLLLRETLQAVLYWRSVMLSTEFILAWEQHLAYKGQAVEIWGENGRGQVGVLEGLEDDGSLRIRTLEGEKYTARFGEVHLRPRV